MLKDLGNVEAIKIAKVLINDDSETITDEQIAEKAELELKICRKILYILDENHLMEFHRVRDKKSGWYSYYWNHNFDNLDEFLKQRKRKVIDNLETRMKYEDQIFFQCEECQDTRYTLMNAMDYGFECPECGSGKLIKEERDGTVDLLKKKIVELRSKKKN